MAFIGVCSVKNVGSMDKIDDVCHVHIGIIHHKSGYKHRSQACEPSMSKIVCIANFQNLSLPPSGVNSISTGGMTK